MKKNVAVLLGLFVAWGFTSILKAQDTQEVRIQGMHCQSCVRALTKSVCDQLKLSDCQVELTDRKEKQGVLKFKPSEESQLPKVEAAIRGAGYEVLPTQTK